MGHCCIVEVWIGPEWLPACTHFMSVEMHITIVCLMVANYVSVNYVSAKLNDIVQLDAADPTL